MRKGGITIPTDLGRSEFYLWDDKSKKSIYVSVCANRD